MDLPFVDTLLMLRPTSSATLFLQQLGRGLRHDGGKASCLVLDFIGQHREEFRFDTVLSALTGVPRARLRRAVEDGFPFLPSGCVVQLDAVARDEILRSLRESIAGAKRLAEELRELSAERTEAVTLGEFLDETRREVTDVYDAGGWTALRRRAGVVLSDDDAEELSRRFGRLLHVDEPARLRAYRDAVTGGPVDRRRVEMLDCQLWDRGTMRAAEDTVAYLRGRSVIAEEIAQLHDVLDAQVGLATERYPVPDWPLALHHHYSRREIVAAVGYVPVGAKKKSLQGGILRVDDRCELLFVTLDKSGAGFSPTTRYRDYAIGPERFHWETQSAASVSRPSGRRYLESASNGMSFHLFVRATRDEAFAYLGPASYESHSGDRPIAIVWRLEYAMPGALYDRYATLATG